MKENNKKIMNKIGLSLMVSYVLLISITMILSFGVYMWLKDYANVSENIDCKDGTSIRLEDSESIGINFNLSLKNNGYFSVAGFILHVGNNTQQTPITRILPMGSFEEGYWEFDDNLVPGEIENASFIKPSITYDIQNIQIQPYIRDEKGNLVLCEQSLIKQDL